MTSNPQDENDSTKAISSPCLQPFLTDAVSRPSRTQDTTNFDHPDESAPERDGPYEDGIQDSVRKRTEDKRPWYRKPSPWWMLTMMPISAMTIAGIIPGLYQVYTELVCRSIRHGAPSRLASAELRAPHSLDLSEHLSISKTEERDYTFEVFSRSDSYVWVQHETGKGDQDCSSDPAIQAEVSRLAAALLTSTGVLSCITAASWASLSDRFGRRAILILTQSAAIINYSTFICVYYSVDHLPGGYWMLLFGPIFYGLLGGSAGTTAATNAYITDCTPMTERAQIYSLTLGLRFTGMAIGPTLSSLLVRASGTPVAGLFLAVATHIVYVLMMIFVVPESLSAQRQAENRRVWREARESVPSQNDNGSEDGPFQRAKQLSLSLAKAALAFLRPLSIAGPITVNQPSGRTHKDWSLTFIAISAGLASMILASSTSMFQFGAAMYGWSAVELGYWYSGIIAARALTLTVFLPVIIKAYHYFTARSLKTPSSTTHTDADSDAVTPLLSEDIEGPSSSHAEPTDKAQVQAQKTPAFDLAIAQASLALEVVCYALVPMVFARGPMLYIILTVLASCGSGFGPAIQALAVDLYSGRGGTETGRLFGVLSVVQTTSSQILGPAIYGLTYMKLVSFYPQGIFFVSVAAVVSALAFLLFVELPGKNGYSSSPEGENSA